MEKTISEPRASRTSAGDTVPVRITADTLEAAEDARIRWRKAWGGHAPTAIIAESLTSWLSFLVRKGLDSLEEKKA